LPSFHRKNAEFRANSGADIVSLEHVVGYGRKNIAKNMVFCFPFAAPEANMNMFDEDVNHLYERIYNA